MILRRVLACLALPAAFLVACSGSESGTAEPGIVATTTLISTQAGPTVTAPAVTSVVTQSVPTSITVRTTISQPVTVTATVTKAPPAVTTRKTTPTPTGWTRHPNSDGVNDDIAFPDSLPGWTMSTNWQAGPRAFPNTWTPAAGPDGGRFPSTMNGCNDQRFLVRWHVQGAKVKAAWADAAGDRHDQVTGSNGWFDLDSCGYPEFQALAGGGGIADVSVDVQQYVTA